MNLYLNRLYIQDSSRSVGLASEKAGVTCDGSDHDLQGWVADAYFPVEIIKDIAGWDYPLSIRLITIDGVELFGKALIRSKSVYGSEIYLRLAGTCPLIDLEGKMV